MTEERTWDFKSKQYKDKEDKIVPPFIGESIERSKRRKEELQKIIMLVHQARADWIDDFSNVGQTLQTIVERLEKLKEEL